MCWSLEHLHGDYFMCWAMKTLTNKVSENQQGSKLEKLLDLWVVWLLMVGLLVVGQWVVCGRVIGGVVCGWWGYGCWAYVWWGNGL